MNGFCPLASGSKGNALYIGTEKTKLLIDAGISARALKLRLQEIGVEIDQIDAVVVSHEHTDHIRGLDTLAGKMGIPIFANSDTAKAISSTLKNPVKFKIFSTGETFEFGDLEIHPFSIQHDTLDPVAFTFKTEKVKVGVCADLGFVTTLVTSHLQECDYLYLESNHEPSMVYSSARPPLYKQRVLGRQGHISNEACGKLLASIYHDNLKHVYLAHLSEECNHPEVALKKVKGYLSNQNLSISIAFQNKVSVPVYF